MNNLRNKNEITSLELLKEVNKLRKLEYNYKIENGLELGKVELKNGRYTELRHDNLINIIRDEFEEEINALKILEVTYKDKKGELRPMYILTLSQAKQVFSRESKFVRRRMIKYIEKLEQEIKKPKEYTIKELLQMQLESIEKIEQLELENKNKEKLIKEKENIILEQTPKVDFYNTVTESEDMFDFKKVAKIINVKGLGRNNLIALLREQKILDYSNTPYQKYVNLDYFKVVEREYNDYFGNSRVSTKTVVFQKGIDFILRLLKRLGYLGDDK